MADHKRDIRYSHADTLVHLMAGGLECFQIIKVKQHFRQFLAMRRRVLHIFVNKIKCCQLHNPFIDSQTSWYFLLTTTEIPIIIPGSAHPCWILATTKNLKSHLISWYIISLWLLSNGRLLDETIFKISSAHERPNCVYSKLEDFDASIVSHFHTLLYVQWPHQSSM